MYWLLCLDQLTTQRRSLLVGDDEPSKQGREGRLLLTMKSSLLCDGQCLRRFYWIFLLL